MIVEVEWHAVLSFRTYGAVSDFARHDRGFAPNGTLRPWAFLLQASGHQIRVQNTRLGTRMAAKRRMETLTSRVVAPSPPDWLDNCAFTSRHGTLVRSAPRAILTQKFENRVPPKIQAGRERVIFPMIDRALEPLTKPLPRARELRTLTDFSSASPKSKTENLPPPKKIRQLPDSLAAELHSFRQLSSPFFCPETSMDTLPEYILFGLVALLAVAWPILAMLRVMARS
jgi:hypothetical protein